MEKNTPSQRKNKLIIQDNHFPSHIQTVFVYKIKETREALEID